MYKNISSFGRSEFVDITTNGLSKLASLETHVPEKLAHKIKEIEQNKDPEHVYLYDRALGAGEVYGPNNNGDFFPRESLKANHETFEKYAKLYRHHQNKDPSKGIGDVVASAYNGPLDTVDIIIRAKKAAVQKDLEKLDNGGMIQTSMGAKLPYDTCSYCGNKAKTRMQYCSHLRTSMLKVMPNGRQVYAINDKPRFMDISIVVIPAAPESTVLKKIASFQKFASLASDENETNERGVVHSAVIDALSTMDLGDSIKTLHDSKGVIRPDEFEALIYKDASLLWKEKIPYVSYRMTKNAGLNLSGITDIDVACALQRVPDVSMPKKASYDLYQFRDRNCEELYMTYRNSINYSREYLR